MNSFTLLPAFLLGLLGGVHCVVMCGGVVGVLCSGLAPHVRARPARRLRLTLGYNIGRIASYSIGGIIAGGVGALAVSVAPVHVAQLVLKAIAAALMLGVGLYLAGIWPSFARLERVGAPLWARVEPFARRLLPLQSMPAAIGLGLIWGWLPCGLVYSAMALALAGGSALGGGATMLAFGLGTLPMLLAMGIAADSLAEFVRRARVRLGVGLVMATLGVFGLMTVVTATVDWERAGTSQQHWRAHCH